MLTLEVHRYKSELLSLEQNKDAPILGKDAMVNFESKQRPVQLLSCTNCSRYPSEWLAAPPDHPHFSILLHPAHAKAPPAYIQISGLDPLRDEGILYAKVLQEAGVTVQYDMYVVFLCSSPCGTFIDLPNL